MLSDFMLLKNLYLTRQHPVSLVHFVTRRCNARCSFCFIDFSNPKSFENELSLEEINRLTSSLGSCLQNVNLTGGEPFIRKDMPEIARCYFKNTSVRSLFITSNGSLPQKIERFLRILSGEFSQRKVIFSFSIDALKQKHDEIRKIKGLFDSVLESYRLVGKFAPFAQANIGITISHDNYQVVPELYDTLIDKYGIKALTVGIVRDEGVYRIPLDHKKRILETYSLITGWILRDLKSGRLEGFDQNSLQGRLMNKKNRIMYDVIKRTYLDPFYISPCRAGSLFGIIDADGIVYPCEILDRPLGNVRDYGCDFMKLWKDKTASETRDWIKTSKCHCTYECAWSFNILSNFRYQPALITAAFKKNN